MRKFIISAAALLQLCSATTSFADSADSQAEILRKLDALTKAVSDLKGTVQKQQGQINSLTTENTALKTQVQDNSAAVAAAAPAPAAPMVNASASNPEIGVVGDITGIATESGEDAEGNDKLSVRELELVFGHDVDPFSRFDATIALSDFEDVEVEEAYLTHWGLPWDIGAKLGRMHPKIGKASASHRDSLETVDEPLVVSEYLGVEGLFKTGAEFSHFLPSAGDSFAHDLTGGIMEGGAGEDGTVFGETERRPTYYGRYRASWDASDVTNLELGGTYLLGSSDNDSKYEVNVFGTDATLIHYFTPINRFKLQSEAYFQDRDEPALLEDEEEPSSFDSHPFGYYLLADYRLSESWGLGARYDFVQPTNGSEGPRDEDVAYAGYLTFFQSEFARWRTQYEHLDFAEGGDDNRYFLQGTFAIGVHKHALQ